MAILPAPPGRARRRGQRIARAAPETGAATGPLRRPLGPSASAAAGPAVPAAPAAEPLATPATTATTTAPAATTTTATTATAAATRAEVPPRRPPVSIPIATTTGRRRLRLLGRLPSLLRREGLQHGAPR